MKIGLVITINLFFWFIGFYYKKKIKNERDVLNELKDFVFFYETNITLYKNDLHEIFNNYIITHKNKNAQMQLLFQKINNQYQINEIFLKDNVSNKQTFGLIFNYFSNIGKGNFEFEKEKSSNFKTYLSDKIQILDLDIKTKGDVFLKIMVAIGLVLSILIW